MKSFEFLKSQINCQITELHSNPGLFDSKCCLLGHRVTISTKGHISLADPHTSCPAPARTINSSQLASSADLLLRANKSPHDTVLASPVTMLHSYCSPCSPLPSPWRRMQPQNIFSFFHLLCLLPFSLPVNFQCSNQWLLPVEDLSQFPHH